ncbi:MAG: hypothetical protein ABSF25_12295 [Bryobacteraceae bacterium]|jgi:hypothetical protein
MEIPVHAQWPPGAAFAFSLPADPHFGEGIGPELYNRSLRDGLASSVDSPIDPGDASVSDPAEQNGNPG